jgi:glutathione S-transferase
MRPEALRWQEWIDHQNEKISRGLDALATKCAQIEPSPLIGEIIIACALGYRDFRYADDDWRAGRPALTDWFETIMQRESMQQTVPA